MDLKGRHEKGAARADLDPLTAGLEAGPPPEHDIHLVLVVGRLVVRPAGPDRVRSQRQGRHPHMLNPGSVGALRLRVLGGGGQVVHPL